MLSGRRQATKLEVSRSPEESPGPLESYGIDAQTAALEPGELVYPPSRIPVCACSQGRLRGG